MHEVYILLISHIMFLSLKEMTDLYLSLSGPVCGRICADLRLHASRWQCSSTLGSGDRVSPQDAFCTTISKILSDQNLG